MATGEGGAAIYGLMLFWSVSTAAFLLTARVAGATLAVAIACLAGGQLVVEAPFALAQTVVCAGVLGATVLLIFGLRRRTEDALQSLELAANTDSLSGVANRRAFERRLDGALRRRRSADADVAVVLLDLDNFKEVNDIWGHEMGDAIVVETGSVLRAETRESELVARLVGRRVRDPDRGVRLGVRARSGEASAVLNRGAVRGCAARPHRQRRGRLGRERHGPGGRHADRRRVALRGEGEREEPGRR